MNENTLVGQTVGNYSVEAFIAKGGFGSVYRGRHLVFTDRPPVALKILKVNLAAKEEYELFLQEARVLEKLKHPSILKVLDAGLHQQAPYLVMAYAGHGSLLERLSQQQGHPFPLHEALRIIAAIGSALHYAHQQGVIHRDLKPANILFDDQDTPLLADFGIATLSAQATTTHVDVVGSPPYMAPEIFAGTASRKSDQYALACIAYELFTGHHPFHALPTATVWEWMHLHSDEPPTPPISYNSYLPEATQLVLLQALSKERSERYASVAAFIDALEYSLPGARMQGARYRLPPLVLTPANAPTVQDALPALPNPVLTMPDLPLLPKDGQQILLPPEMAVYEPLSAGIKFLAFLCYLFFWPGALILLSMKHNQSRFLRFHAWQATLFFLVGMGLILLDSHFIAPKNVFSLLFVLLAVLTVTGWLAGLWQTLRGKMSAFPIFGGVAFWLVRQKALFNVRRPYQPPVLAYGAQPDLTARLFAALCYLLLGVPGLFYLFVRRKKHFVVYHAFQAALFFALMLVLSAASFSILLWFLAPVIVASWLLGIFSSLGGKYAALPFVGSFVERRMQGQARVKR